MEPDALVRRYYDAIDDHAYDVLESILAPEFVQRRPDRTFEGRSAFVEFMRDGRPNPVTSHDVRELTVGDDEVTVRGRLLDAEGEELFSFVDRFTVQDGEIVRLETATD